MIFKKLLLKNIGLVVVGFVFLATNVAAKNVKSKKSQGGTIRGLVNVVGVIPQVQVKKPKKKFNPYGYAYKKKKSEETVTTQAREGHMVVYLEGVKWENPGRKRIKTLGQKDKQFSTDVLAVVGGDRLNITNNDTVYHHIFSKKKPWNFDLKKKGPGKTNRVQMKKSNTEGIGVVPVFCNFHSNMVSNILIMENPYFNTIAEEGGKFVIRNVPPGTYWLTAWHPSLKPIKKRVTVLSNKTVRSKLTMKGAEK